MTVGSGSRLSRRAVVLGLTVGAASALSGCTTRRRDDASGSIASRPSWPQFDDDDAIRVLGRAVRDVDPATVERGRAIQDVAHGDDAVAGRAELAAAVDDDVAAGRFLEVDGWILPHALASVAAATSV